MYHVTIALPNIDKDEQVELDGLGVFENGYDYSVSRSEADAFHIKHGRSLADAFEETDGVDVREMTPEELDEFESEPEPEPQPGPAEVQLPVDNQDQLPFEDGQNSEGE